MFGKWNKKRSAHYYGKSSSTSNKTEKDHHHYQSVILGKQERKRRIRKSPPSKSKMMIMGLTPKNEDHANTIPSLPSEDIMSFDTLHSTPRAKTKMHRNHVDVYDRFGQQHQKKVKDSSSKIMESFVLPFSIDFISLLLPGGEDAKVTETNIADRNDEESSCAMSTSDAGGGFEDATITSGAFSFISGRTVLAKDRVQETISSTINIDRYFNSSPRAIEEFPSFHQLDVPINVDFVLESSEDELAVFAKRCLTSGNFRDAIDIYESVLDIHLKQHKKNHRFVIPILHNLTVVHTWNGNYNKALYYCNECLTWRREKLGCDHIDVAASLSELGIIHYAKEDFNKALGAFREALQIYSKVNKPHRPNHSIARTLNNIGCIHFSTGKLGASLSTFEECLELQRRTMGSITGARVDRMLFNMSVTLINTATVAEKQGHSIHASSLMEEGLIVLQSVLPDDHRIVTTVRKTLSRIESLQDQLTVDSSNSTGFQRGLGGQELTLRQRLHNICNIKESSKAATMEAPEDLNLSCAEMLTLGSPKSDLNIQERIKLHMNKNRLPQALIAEGNSKRHCSWVDINNNDESGRDKDFNFLDISQKAAKYIKVSTLSILPFSA
jgi:tetratricopeptide (TPR) repeat protein